MKTISSTLYCERLCSHSVFSMTRCAVGLKPRFFLTRSTYLYLFNKKTNKINVTQTGDFSLCCIPDRIIVLIYWIPKSKLTRNRANWNRSIVWSTSEQKPRTRHYHGSEAVLNIISTKKSGKFSFQLLYIDVVVIKKKYRKYCGSTLQKNEFPRCLLDLNMSIIYSYFSAMNQARSIHFFVDIENGVYLICVNR